MKVIYKHTQIGYLMLIVTLAVLSLFAWVYSTASAEPPSMDSGPNFAVTAIMALILCILASFTTLTTSIDESHLRIKFGYGIFAKTFPLHQIASVQSVKNHWYYGWGVKVWFWPYMWIYNVSGFDAVEIIMRNGKVYRIGTDMPGELEAAIKQRMHPGYPTCLVLLPYEKISDSQLFQAMAHGAKVRAIKHPKGFDGCMQLIQEFTEAHPEYVLVNSKNDMRIVGQETIALEILQDFSWHVPDWISIPVGNSGNLAALLNSLIRAKEFGLIDRLPGVIAAQAASADTLVRWARSGFTKYEPKEFKDTVATAMNINDPVSFPRVKKLYEKFNIKFYSVEENHILKTWAQFTRAGANICPQSAVALHAVLQARTENVVTEKDVVVSIATASGIKFAEAGIKFHKSGSEENFANSYRIAEGDLQSLENSL